MDMLETSSSASCDDLDDVRGALARLGPGGPSAVLGDLADGLPESVDRLWSGTTSEGPVDVIDFFSGAGGMSSGFRLANALVPAFSLALAADIDPEANRSYEANLGLRPRAADVSELASDDALLDRLLEGSGRREGKPLVLIGCAPCQGFSSHRNAHGHADKRNNLFADFSRIALKLEPDLIVMENVPELCSDAYWPHVRDVVRRLRAGGYRTHLDVHNMAAFGVPQERFRAVLIASRSPFHVPSPTRARDRFRTVRQAIGGLPAIRPGEQHPGDPQHRTAGHRESTVATIRSVAHDGGNRSDSAGPRSLAALKERQGKAAYEDVYGRLWWDKPSITITAYSRNPASGRYSHPEQDRGLSIREAALLQGFPSAYAFEGGFDSRFRQIGNAVPPLFAAHLALSALATILDPPADFPGPGITSSVGPSFARLIPALKSGTRTLSYGRA